VTPPGASGPDENERPSVVFILIVSLVALYLGVRLVQGVIWVAERFG